ncbi:MAG TPA: NAD-dependent epimerase/dehydratase family protein, partial [Candidatus Bathyarchaeia archaeon]|nr:NAD-dependent epimerase/dehydratase family protein [Candidatus Bathyarchaeia archaeon]
ASTYGDGTFGYDDDEAKIPQLQPLNLYGWSKQKFDCWVLEQGVRDQVVGLKFFNVFGPNEYHKGEMRSVINKAYPVVAKEGKISLFKSYRPDFADGEQKRDFIYIRDAVDVVIFFYEHPDIHGIYNVGTGVARSWNDLAKAMFVAAGKPVHIDYIEMPVSLREHYQYFTQASVDKLRHVGFKSAFMSLEDAVKDYVRYLSTNSYL